MQSDLVRIFSNLISSQQLPLQLQRRPAPPPNRKEKNPRACLTGPRHPRSLLASPACSMGQPLAHTPQAPSCQPQIVFSSTARYNLARAASSEQSLSQAGRCGEEGGGKGHIAPAARRGKRHAPAVRQNSLQDVQKHQVAKDQHRGQEGARRTVH